LKGVRIWESLGKLVKYVKDCFRQAVPRSDFARNAEKIPQKPEKFRNVPSE